jgi:hypothetical protein
MIKTSHKTRIATVSAVIAADILFFTTTNAAQVVSTALIGAFCLAIATVYLLASQIIRLISAYGVPLRRRQRQFALFITGSVAGILALVTAGEFTSRDMLVIMPLIIISIAYGAYGRNRSTPTA